jgi:hypothetical protein
MTRANSDEWLDAYFELPDANFSGVNQGPQSLVRYETTPAKAGDPTRHFSAKSWRLGQMRAPLGRRPRLALFDRDVLAAFLERLVTVPPFDVRFYAPTDFKLIVLPQAASLENYRWQSHCHGLFDLPVAGDAHPPRRYPGCLRHVRCAV